MNWKTDHNLLSKKITERIAKTNGEISYSDLEQIAIDKDIAMPVFERAIETLHRQKKVTQRTKGEEIFYKLVPKPKRKPPNSHVAWLNANYPRPDNFVMPFPDIDMSYLFLKPADMKAFRAEMKGMPVYMMKNIHRKK